MSFPGIRAASVACLFFLLITCTFSAQQLPQAVPPSSVAYQQTYDRLLKAIDAIPIFDNHGHPGLADDPNVDAMVSPPDGSSAFRLRADNPELIAASKAVFNYPYDDIHVSQSQGKSTRFLGRAEESAHSI
jgi:hypothetical protein